MFPRHSNQSPLLLHKEKKMLVPYNNSIYKLEVDMVENHLNESKNSNFYSVKREHRQISKGFQKKKQDKTKIF